MPARPTEPSANDPYLKYQTNIIKQSQRQTGAPLVGAPYLDVRRFARRSHKRPMKIAALISYKSLEDFHLRTSRRCRENSPSVLRITSPSPSLLQRILPSCHGTRRIWRSERHELIDINARDGQPPIKLFDRVSRIQAASHRQAMANRVSFVCGDSPGPGQCRPIL
jgi:hypothetical protein